MSDIEFTVSFVGILLALLVANVTNNMADAHRARRDLPIGFVPWAISFYLVAAVANAYALYDAVADDIVFDLVTIVIGMATILPYIFLSRFLYPEHPKKWASVEDYYLSNRVFILGLLAIAPLIGSANWFYTAAVPLSEILFVVSVLYVPVIATQVLLMLTAKRQWHWAGWSFLIFHRVGMMVWLAVSTA